MHLASLLQTTKRTGNCLNSPETQNRHYSIRADANKFQEVQGFHHCM